MDHSYLHITLLAWVYNTNLVIDGPGAPDNTVLAVVVGAFSTGRGPTIIDCETP